MEKKPVKRSEHIVKLSRDHHASLLFCWKLRQGIRFGTSLERMKKYVSYFSEAHMLPHFTEEEKFLFAPLPEDEQVQRALSEHKHIVQEVRKVIDFPGEGNIENYAALADLVDKHVRFEERELFPHLEQCLNNEQLLEIEKQLGDEALKDNYTDDFWVKKSPVSGK